MTMTPADRYRVDPLFAQLVKAPGLTPTEVREAASLAWQMYSERHAHPLLIVRPPSAD